MSFLNSVFHVSLVSCSVLAITWMHCAAFTAASHFGLNNGAVGLRFNVRVRSTDSSRGYNVVPAALTLLSWPTVLLPARSRLVPWSTSPQFPASKCYGFKTRSEWSPLHRPRGVESALLHSCCAFLLGLARILSTTCTTSLLCTKGWTWLSSLDLVPVCGGHLTLGVGWPKVQHRASGKYWQLCVFLQVAQGVSIYGNFYIEHDLR